MSSPETMDSEIAGTLSQLMTCRQASVESSGVVAKKMSGGYNGEGIGGGVAMSNCLCACYIQAMPCMVLTEIG